MILADTPRQKIERALIGTLLCQPERLTDADAIGVNHLHDADLCEILIGLRTLALAGEPVTITRVTQATGHGDVLSAPWPALAAAIDLAQAPDDLPRLVVMVLDRGGET